MKEEYDSGKHWKPCTHLMIMTVKTDKMFSNIDVQKLSPDLKLFWQAQKKVLETKDSRGNRWHPKSTITSYT